MSTALGIGLLSIVILAAGAWALWSMDARRDRRSDLEREWESASKRLGLVARVSTEHGAPSLSAPTPEGRLELTVGIYRSTAGKLLQTTGTSATWIDVHTRGHSGLRISERGLLSRGIRRTSGEDTFDDAFAVEGPDDVVFALLSDSLRSRLLEVMNGGGPSCFELSLVGGRFHQVRAGRTQTASELRDLVREALSIARLLNERSEMPIEEALLDNLRNDRSLVVKRGCLEALARSHPQRLPEAVQSLAELGLTELHEAALSMLRSEGRAFEQV